jgi:integrase
MSENAITAALRRMGYSGEEHTGHGWRSTFSTIANESDKWSRDLIEISLAHGDEDKVRGIYNRAEYRTKRAELAQWYSDQLDLFRRGGAEIVALPAKQA